MTTAVLDQPAVYEALVQRVRRQYADMPGLSPTVVQAQRLFGFDAETCRDVLDTLVKSGFLERTDDGRYVRFDVGA